MAGPVGDYISSNGASAHADDKAAQRLVVLAFITAIAMPLIGLGLGILVARRPSKAYSRQAVWIIALSLVATAVWILIFTSGVINTSTNDLS